MVKMIHNLDSMAYIKFILCSPSTFSSLPSLFSGEFIYYTPFLYFIIFIYQKIV